MVAIALAHDEGEPPDERFDPLSASSVPASAFEEIAATGQIGHLGFALLLSSVQRVGRRHRYPTPKGHQAWNPDAASEWLSDEFFPRKGVDILSTIKLTVVDEGGLERVLKTAIQNVFRDQARMSPVGKLMPRVRGILQKIPELLDATKLYAGTRAWTIDSNGDRIFSGDWADLLFAPRLRTLTQLERLNPSGPTSAANIARFKDAAIFLLEFAGGALTDSELCSCLVKLFDLDELDAYSLRDDDEDAASQPSAAEVPGQRRVDVEVADQIGRALTDEECLVLPHLDLALDDFARARPELTDPEGFAEGLKAKLAGLVETYDASPEALGIVLARCEDFAGLE